MSTETKIKGLTGQIEDNYLREFRLKFEEVLSFCESPIEKLMLLQLYNYFSSINEKVDWIKSYKVKFIEDQIFLQAYEEIDRIWLKEIIKKYEYRKTNDCYLKYKGFMAVSSFTEPYGNNPDERREFEVYPQYRVKTDNIRYRIDIVIVLKRRSESTGKIFETRRLAIECDGYEFHKDAYREDLERTRRLKACGFKEVLRYSGSEIYIVGNDLQKTHQSFKQMLDIIML